MKSNFIKRIISLSIISATLLTINSTSVMAVEMSSVTSPIVLPTIQHNGWILINDKWYYYANGVMQTGWMRDIDGKYYYLNDDGSMAVNTMINGYRIGMDGAWMGNIVVSNITTNTANNTTNVNNTTTTSNSINNSTNTNTVNNSGIINNGGVNNNVINNNNYYDNSNDEDNSDEDYSEDKDNDNESDGVNDVYDLEDYLNENYSSLKTPIGTLKFDFEIDKNDDKDFPYDFWIQTDWGDIDNPKYDDFDDFYPDDLEDSIQIKEKDKEKTKELLKDFQKKVAKVASKYFPDKKIRGGFYSSGYEYQNIQAGFYSIQFLSWTNYNQDADDYDSSEVDGFNWDTEYDDYDLD